MPTSRETDLPSAITTPNDMPAERGCLAHEAKADSSRYRALGNQRLRVWRRFSLDFDANPGREKPLPVCRKADTVSCVECGGIMVRNGASYRRHHCGSDSGCR